MKRILNVVVMTLAMNFALAAGGVGWLAASGHLTRARIADVRNVLFPPPATQPSGPTTQPTASDEPTDAVGRLGAMVASAAGRAPGEQLEAVQLAEDAQLAELDRRRREMLDVRHQAELAQSQATADHDAVLRDRQSLVAQRDQQAVTAADKGFQESLQLYQTLPARQVKEIFAALPDDTVQQYLQAMDARQAGKIMKEFKSPADVARLQQVLEKIRQARANAPTDPTATAALPVGR